MSTRAQAAKAPQQLSTDCGLGVSVGLPTWSNFCLRRLICRCANGSTMPRSVPDCGACSTLTRSNGSCVQQTRPLAPGGRFRFWALTWSRLRGCSFPDVEAACSRTRFSVWHLWEWMSSCVLCAARLRPQAEPMARTRFRGQAWRLPMTAPSAHCRASRFQRRNQKLGSWANFCMLPRRA